MTILNETSCWAIGLALTLMLMDVVTGFAGAAIRGEVSSAKMRVGLGHKALLLCVIALAVIVEVGAQHVAGLGFGGVTVNVVCAYISVMEVASCLENVCAAYPELRDTPLMHLFDHSDEGSDE